MVMTAFSQSEEDTRICEEPEEVDAEFASLVATCPDDEDDANG